MQLTALQLDAIKTTIETDPNGDGYVVTDLPTAEPTTERSAAMATTLGDVVDKFNAPRGLIISRGPVSKITLWNVVKGIASSLISSELERLQLLLVISDNGIDLEDIDNLALIDSAVPAVKYATENANLKALVNRTDGSRAEQLVGRIVTRGEIATALYGGMR